MALPNKSLSSTGEGKQNLQVEEEKLGRALENFIANHGKISKNYKIVFLTGVATFFEGQHLYTSYLPRLFHNEKVGLGFHVNLRRIATYSEDSVTFSYRYSCL